MRLETKLRQLLTAAVPPLPQPADRLAEIRARVRRNRQRGAAVLGAVVVLIGLAVVVPWWVLGADRAPPAEPPALTADDCPDEVHVTPTVDGSGSLVPPGAVEAAVCAAGLEAGELRGFQVLRMNVDQLVTALNGLPTPDQPGPIRCIEGDVTQLSLVLRYPDGAISTVVMDGYCGISYVPEGPVRLGTVLDEFGRLYQEQVAATAADLDTLSTPTCPATIAADRLDLTSDVFGPEREAIERPIRSPHWVQLDPAQPALPYPLVAATVCRYLPDGDQAQLGVAQSERGDLTDLRDIINDTFQLTENGEERRSECGQDPDQRLGVPDVILVVDATGGTAEYWVYGNPNPATDGGPACWDAFRDPTPIAATPELVDYVLATLGP
jgi:hypothetical protein